MHTKNANAPVATTVGGFVGLHLKSGILAVRRHEGNRLENGLALLVDRIKDSTAVLGPGNRVAIWFHGCTRRCPGCIASGMNGSADYARYAPEALSSRVLAVEGVEGVTISGGEPFDQNSKPMAVFLSSVRAAGLSVMAYTGYLREELESDKDKCGLLGFIDILVDGPYVEGEDHGELWRGSANQRMHFLTERYSGIAASIEGRKGRDLEFELGRGLDFSFTGIPPRGFRNRLAERLGQKGMEINW